MNFITILQNKAAQAMYVRVREIAPRAAPGTIVDLPCCYHQVCFLPFLVATIGIHQVVGRVYRRSDESVISNYSEAQQLSCQKKVKVSLVFS